MPHRPSEMKRVVASDAGQADEPAQLFSPRAHVEIAGDDEVALAPGHKISERLDIFLLKLGIEGPGKVNPHKLEACSVHFEAHPAQHQRDPWREARPVVATLGEDRVLGKNDDALTICGMGIKGLQRLAEQRALRACDLLQNHDIGIALNKELGHLVHAIVAAPQIESNDAQKAIASRRCLRGGTLQTRQKAEGVEPGEQDRTEDQPPVAGDVCKTENEKRTRQQLGNAVIDNVERGPPCRKHAKRG
jgi:hypothetical protein